MEFIHYRLVIKHFSPAFDLRDKYVVTQHPSLGSWVSVILTANKKIYFQRDSSLKEKGRKFRLGLIKIRKVLPEKSFRVPFFWRLVRLCSGFLLRPRASYQLFNILNFNTYNTNADIYTKIFTLRILQY